MPANLWVKLCEKIHQASEFRRLFHCYIIATARCRISGEPGENRPTKGLFMSQIELTFPDGSVRSVASGTTGLEIAKGISEGLARKALGVKLGNKVLDLSRPLT
ncbi:TGS domain-containing protein, partial [Hallerella sp.]|uniref:TGS domain-containing protein n=1 Tax=Hallerella sp. TaxID=2815812 RepID=UPI00338E0DB2